MKLIIEDDEGRKTVVPFVRDEITIGRQEGNTIRLTERNVSRRHARLLRQNGHILVEDLGSYNGIRINGDRIQGQVQVNEGDLIQIGDYDLAVQREAAEAAAAAAHAHVSPTDRTQEVAAVPHRNGTNGAPTKPLPDMGATVPALPVVDSGATLSGDEPDEANPEDVTLQPAAPVDDPAARRQSTAIIRMDQVEQNRARQVVEIDPSDAPRLVILNTELAGREFSCVRTELKIGRTDENDIAIDHRSLSRTHCKVVREDTGEWRVIDMQSANGLMVNGEPYAQSALRSGDVLELGHVKMKFVGAGETFKPGAAADVATGERSSSGGGSKVPLIAGGVLVLMFLAVGGWYMTRPKVGPKVPPPVVDPLPPDRPTANNPPKKVETPPDVELTPEQQTAQVEARLKEAHAKIESGDWAEATNILNTCYIGESVHPEATKLLTELKAEEGLRASIDKADKLVDADQLQKARAELDLSSHTKFLEKRWNEVDLKIKRAGEMKMQQGTVAAHDPPVQKPPPAQPKVPAVNAARAEAERLYADVQPDYKAKNWQAVKTKADKCVKADKTFPDCHKLLGAALGQLGNGPAGAKEYELFLEYAPPDHPSIPKVKSILEAFRNGSK